MSIRGFIQKLQNLSVGQKKMILWSIVVVLGIIMSSFWIKNLGERIKDIDQNKFIEQLNLPPVGDEIQKMEEQQNLIEIKVQQELEDLKNNPELLEELKKEATPEEWQEIQKELENQKNNTSQ